MHQMAGGDVDWKAIREDFPILRERAHGHPLIYFDSAATSQKPQPVLDALRNYYEHNNANVHRGLHELSSRATEAYEISRQHVAKYIGAATADEIIFTRGTTEGINLVAQAWGGKFLRAGDVILLTEMEHHSNLVPWQLLAARTGVRLRFVPVCDDGTLALEQLPSLLTPEVKLFAFTHISNSLGTINPVAKLCRKARAMGVLTLVDAAQSAGHLSVDVQEIGCDFLAFSGHKMCGPTGSGALYGRAEILETIPPWHGGGEMIVSVTLEKSAFKKPPHRFEAGTPNIAGAIGLAAAIQYIEQIGRPAVFEHDSHLARYAAARLTELPGMRVFGPTEERGALVGFVMDAAVRVHGDNPACGDEIHLSVKFDGGGSLHDIKFTGHGCAISQASASLMTMKLKGKNRAEVMEMLDAFHDLVTDATNEAPKTLGDLRVMKGV